MWPRIMPPDPKVAFVVISTICTFADGCLRGRKPLVLSTPRPDDSTTINPTHKLECNHEEMYSLGCLNGGSCFAIVLNEGVRRIQCSCPSEWWGYRCEMKHIDPSILQTSQQNRMVTANIAAGVSVLVLLVFIVLLAVYVFIRYKQKQKDSQSVRISGNNPDKNGIAATNGGAPNEDGKPPANSHEMMVHFDNECETVANSRPPNLANSTEHITAV